MRRPRHKLEVSTFPFLAVLLCAMGALILFLLVMDRRAKLVAQLKAQEAAAAHAAELELNDSARKEQWEQQRAALHQALLEQQQALQGEAKQLQAQLTAAGKQVQATQAEQDAVTQAALTRGLTLAELRAQLKSKQAGLKDSEQQATVVTAELKRLNAQVAELETVLAELKSLKRQEHDTYSLVPYQGKRGDTRNPIYIECTRHGLIFHPDRKTLQGLELDAVTLRSEVERRAGTLEREVSRKKGHEAPPGPPRGPYVLFLIRPDGIMSYYHALEFLRGFEIDFGYEVVDPHWVLDFSPGDHLAGAPPWDATVRSGVARVTGPGLRPPEVSQPLPLLPPGMASGVVGVPGGTSAAPGPGGPANSGLPGNGFGSSKGSGSGTGGPGGAGTGGAGSGIGVPGAQSPGNGTGPDGRGLPGAGLERPGINGQSLARGPRLNPDGSGVASAPGVPGGVPGIPGYPGGSANSAGDRGPSVGIGTGNFAGGPGGAIAGFPTGEPGALASGGTSGGGPPGANAPGSPIGPPNSNSAGVRATASGLSASGPGGAGASSSPGAGSGTVPAVKPAPDLPLSPGPSGGPPAGQSKGATGTGNSGPASPGAATPQPGGASGVPAPWAVPGASVAKPPDGPAAPSDGGSEPQSPGTKKPALLGTPSTGKDASAGWTPPSLGMPPLPGDGKNRPRPAPLGQLLGNRDFVITITCYSDHVTVYPGGKQHWWKDGTPATIAPRVLENVQGLIAGRQRGVPPGEALYRPLVRFQLAPDGLTAYLHLYPRLAILQVPMSRENLEE